MICKLKLLVMMYIKPLIYIFYLVYLYSKSCKNIEPKVRQAWPIRSQASL